MAINSLGQNLAIYGEPNKVENTKDKTKLDKDSFLKLMLVSYQHQDPTEPMDTEKILTQTSQLATLEASTNTNKALEGLASSLGNSQQFTTISAIGKIADLGSDMISNTKGSSSSFEVYFPKDVKSGTIEITDNNKKVIKTIDLAQSDKGVHKFDWNGKDANNNYAQSGLYHINAKYKDQDDKDQTTKLGSYPIESIKFEGSNTLVKIGSNYVPLSSIKEVYQ
jgi:flagellar basal-body rod modification protein FlgD